jgi:hypothetical protein
MDKKINKVVWNTIMSRPPVRGRPTGIGGPDRRPKNFKELGILLMRGYTFEYAWSEFLHEFYRYQTIDFFQYPPVPIRKKAAPLEIELNQNWCALLAGATEFLCDRFSLRTPGWVYRPEYFLPEIWDPVEDVLPAMEEFRHKRITQTPAAFLKRNVVFNAENNLTTL